MKRNLLFFVFTGLPLLLFSQDGNFNTINFNKLVKEGNPIGINGWGESFKS